MKHLRGVSNELAAFSWEHAIQDMIDVQSWIIPQRRMTVEELCKLAKTTAKVGSNTSINCKDTQVFSAINFVARQLIKSTFPLHDITCIQYTMHHFPLIITIRNLPLKVTSTTLATFYQTKNLHSCCYLFTVLNSGLLFYISCFTLTTWAAVELFSTCDCGHSPMTLTLKLDLDSIKWISMPNFKVKGHLVQKLQ